MCWGGGGPCVHGTTPCARTTQRTGPSAACEKVGRPWVAPRHACMVHRGSSLLLRIESNHVGAGTPLPPSLHTLSHTDKRHGDVPGCSVRTGWARLAAWLACASVMLVAVHGCVCGLVGSGCSIWGGFRILTDLLPWWGGVVQATRQWPCGLAGWLHPSHAEEPEARARGGGRAGRGLHVT